MKMTAMKVGRQVITLILTVMLVLSISTPAFAGWEPYSGSNTTSNVYLKQTSAANPQIIECYSEGQLVRTAAAQKNTFWIDGTPVFYNLFDTYHWCFDGNGNIFAVDTSKRLALCLAGTTTFVVNDELTGCSGFERDKTTMVGYYVYTSSGMKSLADLLNNYYGSNISNNISNNTITNNNVSQLYPRVEKLGSCYYYHVSSTKTYKYFYDDTDLDLFYLGTNDKESNVYMATGVQDINFTPEGYISYASVNGSVDGYPVGKTESKYKVHMGDNFSYFDHVDYISQGYVDINGVYQTFSYSSYSNNRYDDNHDDHDDNKYYYPRIKVDGNYFYVYTSETKWYKYAWYNSNLYYYGTNSKSASTLISSSVKKITFDIYEGYIAYALSNNNSDVYVLPFGKTSNSYRIKIGSQFSSFDNYYGKYSSKGYTSKNGYYREFADYYDNKYEEVYPHVEYDDEKNYYYIYTSSSKYYIYYFSSSGNLYYKGTNSSSISTKIASDIEEIRFSPEGYILYADEDDKVNSLPLGKTSSSYEEYQGNKFSEFDDDDEDFLCDGYINTRGDYVEFEFD